MSKRILVIDDDEAIRKFFLLSLEDTGYQVVTVPSGQKGVQAVEKDKYDLVYLDLKMPGMDGVETLRELRKIDKEVPVYIITAFHGEFFDRLKDVEKDGMDFEIIHKPIDTVQLMAVTKGVLEGPQEI